jgi:hypothetical protein
MLVNSSAMRLGGGDRFIEPTNWIKKGQSRCQQHSTSSVRSRRIVTTERLPGRTWESYPPYSSNSGLTTPTDEANRISLSHRSNTRMGSIQAVATRRKWLAPG